MKKKSLKSKTSKSHTWAPLSIGILELGIVNPNLDGKSLTFTICSFCVRSSQWLMNRIYQLGGDTLVLNVTLSVTEKHGTASMLQPLKSAEDKGMLIYWHH
jgi:hypothetical protein